MHKTVNTSKVRSTLAKNSPMAIASALYIVIFMTNI